MSNRFVSWQARTPGPPFNRDSPNLLAVRAHLERVFGIGEFLGLYANRPVRQGTSPSSHAFGAALDWRYPPGKRLEVCDYLTSNYEVLGIQAVHDYSGARIWRADRLAWRHSTSSMMGDAWATFVHIETHPDHWANATPISERAANNTQHKEVEETMLAIYVPRSTANSPDWSPNHMHFCVFGNGAVRRATNPDYAYARDNNIKTYPIVSREHYDALARMAGVSR